MKQLERELKRLQKEQRQVDADDEDNESGMSLYLYCPFMLTWSNREGKSVGGSKVKMKRIRQGTVGWVVASPPSYVAV
jgi:hypothetical protein